MEYQSRRRWRRRLAAVVAALVVLAMVPSLAAGRQRAIRHVRAWALGAHLLDDHGVVFQTNDANCGHACLITALVHFGRQVPRELLDRAAHARVGLSIGELTALSVQSGLPARMHHVPFDCLERSPAALAMPSIALVGTHFLLIERLSHDGVVTFIDPAVGRMRAPVSVLERDWREVMVVLGVDETTVPSCG
jgi:ABC-type bacteriocin/lantibiotic exporter with double-glycine peptidase domain